MQSSALDSASHGSPALGDTVLTGNQRAFSRVRRQGLYVRSITGFRMEIGQILSICRLSHGVDPLISSGRIPGQARPGRGPYMPKIWPWRVWRRMYEL